MCQYRKYPIFKGERPLGRTAGLIWLAISVVRHRVLFRFNGEGNDSPVSPDPGRGVEMWKWGQRFTSDLDAIHSLVIL